MRVSTGRFVLSGRAFCNTDTCTNRMSAHRALEDYWVGTAEFHLMIRVPSSSHDHASDSHEDLILMWQALMRGEMEPFADVTEVEYAALKTAAPSARRGFVGFGASFGGGWFGGYGRHSYPAQPYHEAQRSV